ncbi:cytochrome P450 family protein [Nocardia brasiliensis]|uniref:cytochrome P450 family protein n=1 Tax=Nocardia brasiliensis TaxID=37326 RepID=UPI0024553D9C|nr:cytochrome P450 [Nocardia brasiliensis]
MTTRSAASRRCPVEPFSDEFLRDPHPTYDVLREDEPVCPVIMPTGERVWLVTKYSDVMRGLADPRLSNVQRRMNIVRPYSNMPAGVEPEIITDLLNVDPPSHGRLRRVIADLFTAPKAEAFRGHLQTLCDELLDTLTDRGVIDVIGDYAAPFASTATADLLGVPRAEHERFRKWGNEIASVILKTQGEDLTRPATDLHGFVQDLINGKRNAPDDDVLTHLTQAFDEQVLDWDELSSMVHLLLIAGQEGPVNLIGNGVQLLLRNPDQLALLRANPELMAGAVDEMLRLEAPLGLAIYRSSPEPITFSGATIPADEPILFSLLSSGHDATQFDEPDRFDIQRRGRPHLGLGWGRHFCLGASLGRLEGQIAIGALVNRFPDLSLAVPAEQLDWRPSVITRGLVALPVALYGGA